MTNKTQTIILALAACVAVVLALPGSAVLAQDGDAVSAPSVEPDKTATSQPAVAKPVAADAKGRIIELHMRDNDIRKALEMINIHSKNIITTKEVVGKVTADLYGVTFKEALDAILEANNYASVASGNFIYVMTSEQKAARILSQRKKVTKSFPLAYVTAADMRALITPLVSPDGKVAVTPAADKGIGTSSSDSGGNQYAGLDMIVVSDYEENVIAIAKTIKQADTKPMQVLVDAVLLRASLTENNALGIDFNVLGGIDFSAMSATTTGISDITLGTVNAPLKSNVANVRTDFNSSVPSGGLSVGIMTSNVGVFVRALESITDTTVMANPKLLIVNKQRGEVMVGNKDGYLTTTFTETTASQTVEFLETGTRLVVRPYVGRDDYIRLEIHPEDSSGQVATVGESALPSETTTELTSNVLVRDGHTIVIGGLFREQISASRSQTPLLGNIPYLGTLFRSTADTTAREEVIILITPRIIKQEIDELVSEQLKDDADRFRAGQRKGLQWWGRSRLAQTQIRSAREAMVKGDRDQAMWHVDEALSLTPRMEEAIRLKEQLTGKAYWSDQARFSSTKYVIQRMIMHELNKSDEGVIVPKKPMDGSTLDKDVKKAFGISGRIAPAGNSNPAGK